MSTTSRRKDTSVIGKLVQKPYNYSFIQAVRLLERFSAMQRPGAINFAKNPIARFLQPSTEAVRFHSNQSLSFPSSEISTIKPSSDTATMRQWHMLVNFIGLTGSKGVMPYHYSELVLQRLKAKDKTLESFFDLFNHRTTSLFYQACVKYNLPLEYERRRLNPLPGSEYDSHTQVLLSLIGMGTRKLTRRLYTNDESLLYYAGLFSSRVKSTIGLKQILQNHFSIPVQIQEFIGQWQDLIDDVRTMLPGFANPRGQNNCLGKSVLLGRKGWFAQGKIRIILGPLNRQQLNTFAPGTVTLNALNEIVRFYINFEYDYEFIMRIQRRHIPARITLSKGNSPVMGWNTWLASAVKTAASSEETVDIPVSSRRFQ